MLYKPVVILARILDPQEPCLVIVTVLLPTRVLQVKSMY